MNDLKCFSLNCRGLADTAKRRDVFHFLHNYNAHIICLQDVHWVNEKESDYRFEWGHDVFFSGVSSNSRGVAILFKRNLHYSVHHIRRDGDGNFIALNIKIFEYRFNLFNIYGPNNDAPMFFENISSIINDFDDDADFTILCGDWNLVQNFQLDCDAYINLNNPHSHKRVLQLKDDHDLVDPWRVCKGNSRRYTWRRTNPFKQARLDFYLISSNLLNFISGVDILPGYRTDHSIIELCISFHNIQRGRGYWKFNNSLLKNPKYVEMVNTVIDNCIKQYAVIDDVQQDILAAPADDIDFYIDADLFFDTLLLLIRGESIKFSSLLKKDNERKEESLIKDIMNLEKNLDSESMRILNEKKCELQEHRKNVMAGVMTRAKANSIEWGEKPSSFFLNLEKRAAINKGIYNLLRSDGSIAKSQNDITYECYNYYSKLFSYHNYHDFDINNAFDIFIGNGIINDLSYEQMSSLESDITLAELSLALKRQKNDKSPGLDGYTTEFIKFFWKRLGIFFYKAVNAYWRKQKLSVTLRQGIVSLLPKKDKPRNLISNWRPISLLSIFYKILSSCIAERIKSMLPFLIHADQKGFLPGRYIGESIRLLYDILFYTHNRNIPGQLLLLDFEKAFDSISHDYLWVILSRFGFGPNLIKWCKILYSNACSCILINGHLSNFFPLQRGCRQGDPLSPYLFILGVEVLAISVRYNNYIRGISIFTCEVKLSHYADDTIFLLDGSARSLKCVMDVLNNFANLSGLRVNWEKSKALWFGSKCFSEDRLEGFERLIWDPGGTFTYLGVLFSVDLVNIVDINYNKAITTIKQIISHWSKRRLTPLGRLTIVKTILVPKLNYLFINLPNPPDDVLKTLESMFFKFVWNGQDRINRHQFCQPYHAGGIKMINLMEFIHSLKITWLRRFYKADDPSWSSIVFNLYIKTHIEFLFEGGTEYLSNKLIYLSNPFYKDVLVAFIRLKRKLQSNCKHNNRTDIFLWYSDILKLDDKPFIMRDWYTKGLRYASDFLDNEGQFLDLEQFQSNYNVKTNYLRYFGICQAIKSYYGSTRLTKLSQPYHPHVYNILLKSQRGARDFYAILNVNEVSPHAQSKWCIDLCTDAINWKNLYYLPFSLTIDSHYKWFQYRINMRLLATNSFLSKIGVSNTDRCNYCSIEKETILHLFCDCTKIEPLWNSFENFINLGFDDDFHLNKHIKLFGMTHKVSLNKGINKLLIWFRYFIYRGNRNMTAPHFNLYLSEIRHM